MRHYSYWLKRSWTHQQVRDGEVDEEEGDPRLDVSVAPPPNHKAEIAKKLMVILPHFKIIELLKNIFKKIQLLGDW